MPEPIEVRKIPLQHVSDASGLAALIDDGTRDECGDRAATGQRAFQRVAQHEADRALGLRAAPVQRHRRYHGRGELVLHQQVAHLRPVPVRDKDLRAGRRDLRDAAGGPAERGDLVGRGGPPVGCGHRVAAQGDEDDHRRSTSG